MSVFSSRPFDSPEPPKYYYYGVKIELNNPDPESSVEFIDDAIGMSAGYNEWLNSPIISKIKPCVLKDGIVQYYLNPNDFSQKENGEPAEITDISVGDVMIETPKIGYKMEFDEQYQYIWITDNPKADGYCYYAYSLDAENDCDKIYIGAYLGYAENEKIYSVSGKSPVTNISLINARNYADSKGTGYELLSFYPLTLLQCLYTIVYKNLNSQKALGQGYTAGSNTGKINTGGSNSKGMCYGESTGTQQVKFLGIEDFWGNCYQWIDGVFTDSDGNIFTDYNNFDAESYKFSYPLGTTYLVDYIKQIQGTNISGFVPKVGGNGAYINAYYSDYGIILSDKYMRFGGYWNYGFDNFSGVYLAYLNTNDAKVSKDLSCRIMYKHKSK